MGKAFKHGQMVEDMKGNGKMAKWMDKENLYGAKVNHTKENM